MRLLLTGDLHIGRSSTGISSLAGSGELRASTAWAAWSVHLEEEVDLVCLSGDVVDKENKFWEAIGPLERGVKRLASRGIRTVAVAGNHDYDVLARLTEILPQQDFRLLGRRGQWERLTIEEDGRALLHVDGWSFPRERVYESPLDSYDLSPDSSTPVLGIVHGDLDVLGSSYAPLETGRLFGAGPNAWLLGHIHKSSLVSARSGSWILYPGSPQALDFGETGLHGVWTLEVDHRIGSPEQTPLSTARYDYLDVDVAGAESASEVEAAILRSIRQAAKTCAEAGAPYLSCIGLRVTITGRTPIAHRLEEITKNLVDDLAIREGNAAVEIDRLRVSALPDVDLYEYAGAKSAPGAVARLLLALDDPAPGRDVIDLLARTKRELTNVDGHKHFAMLEEREITDEIARAYLRDRARALLTELVRQTA